ncbi:hypothetical protein [Microbispora amethystogenes]|uniref:Uncharacterized protein n=1 Tax=Microbispora amethystogenes TaxID=1427754 RepID=A0ABQ4F813_9ACTN|nr:hypothetical protein [Microbispora amethystogenes]GIH30924.1 hypothetical protein Mam01_10880 [Microbispora amethystogenes]
MTPYDTTVVLMSPHRTGIVGRPATATGARSAGTDRHRIVDRLFAGSSLDQLWATDRM